MNSASAHVYLNGSSPANGQCPGCHQPLSQRWTHDPASGNEKAGLECKPCREKDDIDRLAAIVQASHFPSP